MASCSSSVEVGVGHSYQKQLAYVAASQAVLQELPNHSLLYSQLGSFNLGTGLSKSSTYDISFKHPKNNFNEANHLSKVQ